MILVPIFKADSLISLGLLCTVASSQPSPRSDSYVYNTINLKYRRLIKDIKDEDILNDFENIQISNDNIQISNEK